MNTYRVAYLKKPTSKHATIHEVLAESFGEAAEKVAERYTVPLESITRVVKIPEEKIRQREEDQKKLEQFLKEWRTRG